MCPQALIFHVTISMWRAGNYVTCRLQEPGVGHGSSCGADLKETKYDHQKFCPVHYLNLRANILIDAMPQDRDSTSVLKDLAEWAKVRRGKRWRNTRFDVIPKTDLPDGLRKEVEKIIEEVSHRIASQSRMIIDYFRIKAGRLSGFLMMENSRTLFLRSSLHSRHLACSREDRWLLEKRLTCQKKRRSLSEEEGKYLFYEPLAEGT